MTPWDRSYTPPPVSPNASFDGTPGGAESKNAAVWDERLVRAEAEADSLAREIAWLRAERERAQQEAEERERREYAALQNQQSRASTAAAAGTGYFVETLSAPQLSDAIVRYAVACGAVDVQVALLRARGTAAGSRDHSDALLHLSDALHEQNEASLLLRRLAREIQQARSASPSNEPVAL